MTAAVIPRDTRHDLIVKTASRKEISVHMKIAALSFIHREERGKRAKREAVSLQLRSSSVVLVLSNFCVIPRGDRPFHGF